MIEFEDEKFGNILIIEADDAPPIDWLFANADTNMRRLISSYMGHAKMTNATVIAYREVGNGVVKLFKNRYESLKDCEIRQVILNYKGEKESVFDPIESRFDILDL